MSQHFDPSKDFSLPIGVFTERLLGDGIDPAIKENAAQVQALFLVFDKHLHFEVVAKSDETAEALNKTMKGDFYFKNMHRKPEELTKDLLDLVPAEIDLEREIMDARAIVDAGQGVPNVPPFGMILSKGIPRNVINSCLQIQSGLRLMAIENKWDGVEKLPKAGVFDADPKELKIVQSVWNDMHENYTHQENAKDKNRATALLSFASAVGYTAITDGAKKLEIAGFEDASVALINYMVSEHGIEKEFNIEEAAHLYNKAASKVLKNPGNQFKP